MNSKFADTIQKFIAYKNSLGYPYEESSRILNCFDRFCFSEYPDKSILDRELCMHWLERKSSESPGSHRNRVIVVREFAKFLRGNGTSAYMIPIQMTRKSKRYVPHIFTESEIQAFFQAADSFEKHDQSPVRHLVIPVFFRLLYFCGLRPVEARILLKKNTDLKNGILYIVESKGHKDRFVTLSDEMTEMLRKYTNLVSEVYPDTPFLFPRYDGNGPYTKLWTEEMFWRCFSMAGITEFAGPKPRVYDFRHTFATNCIHRWVREGRDIDTVLPYLSAYMGHVQAADTAYYIHLVPNSFEKMAKVDMSVYESLFPEVPDED